MINSFKKKPLLDGKRFNKRLSEDNKDRHQNETRMSDNFESEEDRESRQYTNFSMFSTAATQDETVSKKDMIQFERSDSVSISKKKIFQNSVQKVIKLQALVHRLKSFNCKLVKATLIEMVPLINNPETAVILKDAGLCTLLLDLLKFDPLSHWSIVGLSLQALLSVVSIPECAITVTQLPNFPSTIEGFLKSDKALTQIIAGRIVYHCFVQPIQHEWIVLQDRHMLGLLFKAMELPFRDMQFRLLGLLEDLTYHCENTLVLCMYAASVEIDFIRLIVDVLLSEAHADTRLRAMKIYLNALTAIQFDRRIERAVIMHALTVETSLLKHMQSLQRFKLRKTTSAGSSSRSSKLCLMADVGSGAPTTTGSADIDRSVSLLARRSSLLTRCRSDGEDEQALGSKKHRERGVAEGGEEAGALLQVSEELGVAAEILWLMRSSGMFRRLVQHSKRTNLVEPHQHVADLIATL